MTDWTELDKLITKYIKDEGLQYYLEYDRDNVDNLIKNVVAPFFQQEIEKARQEGFLEGVEDTLKRIRQ